MVKSKKKRVRLLRFPLIEQAASLDSTFLENLTYIDSNLKHDLRQYQMESINNYVYSQTQIKPSPQHVLFNMATGSGKTDLMAALILYLYIKSKATQIFCNRYGC